MSHYSKILGKCWLEINFNFPIRYDDYYKSNTIPITISASTYQSNIVFCVIYKMKKKE